MGVCYWLALVLGSSAAAVGILVLAECNWLLLHLKNQLSPSLMILTVAGDNQSG